ncbi:unnamed protein product [Tetraodon nigroviridis]|uniref:(spotted green pufferfish) hypothetical protein n=1 Tax=Tetraodon nigroviridis TaxID=99883 RepID=Q4TAD8_TETNG|nr:unnamed protein product [Tetraodon nigroviridis]
MGNCKPPLNLILLQSVRSVNVSNRSSEKKRSGNIRSGCVNWRSRSESSVPGSKKLRSENAVVRKKGEAKLKKNPRYTCFALFFSPIITFFGASKKSSLLVLARIS